MSAGHWTPELVELAGGEPLLGDPGRDSKALNWDAVARSAPDVVLVAPCGFDIQKSVAAAHSLPVPFERVYAIDGNALVNRPGPRLVDTAEAFAAALADEPLDPATARSVVPIRR